MVESFRHKGLQALFENGSSAKVQKALAERALRRLDAIDAAKTPGALNIPGFDFHALQGKPKTLQRACQRSLAHHLRVAWGECIEA